MDRDRSLLGFPQRLIHNKNLQSNNPIEEAFVIAVFSEKTRVKNK